MRTMTTEFLMSGASLKWGEIDMGFRRNKAE
jgi:hypothetical protein